MRTRRFSKACVSLASIIAVERSGHGIPEEAPDVVVDAVREVVREAREMQPSPSQCCHTEAVALIGAGDGIRTRDLLITNQLLYH